MAKIGKAAESKAFGITILGMKHPWVTELLEERPPEIHGEKFWASTWLLLDHLERIRMRPRTRVLEVGCGWGITSAYCAKVRKARVTALDADPHVLPIAELEAKVNGVKIETVVGRFESVPVPILKSTDIIVGADICFWDELVDPLHRMIRRAMRHGVSRVVLADPGRPCFEDLAALCEEDFRAILIDTSTKKPTKADGYVLVVEDRR
jgi:ribosomal protein L11 methylase PrmA